MRFPIIKLRVLQQDKKFKDEVGSVQDGRIIELENKVGSLKARIRILIDKKISINALDMTMTNLIANVNRGLDRIENHIRGVGTPMQNPTNVIDGIRGSLNTIRVTLQNITAKRDLYQNILNDTNNRERDLRNELRDGRNQNLRLQRLLDESRVRVERTVRERDNAQGERDLAMLAYNNERQESRRWMFSYRDKDRRVQGLLREKFAKQLLYQRDTNRLQQNTRQLQTNAQNQNNPLGNMADARRLPVLTMIALVLAKTKPYTGQEPPDDYLDRLIQSISFAQGHMTALENANAGDFDDAVKCGIYKAQMGGKYLPVPAQDPYNGNANINTLATLHSPDTYEKRIRPLLLGVADGDAQTVGFLKNHLSGDLYTWMRAVAPVASLEAQLAESMQVHSNLAQRLQLPENVVNSNNASIFDSYINQELEKRLGVIEINLAKLTKFLKEDIIDTKSAQYRYSESSDYNNGGLEKRLEQIEANLAKFARKDTRSAKTSQH
ncbi:unnamed protein product [Rhizophagus irregularis]|nr:unnamed protein product [Rhizophagus irregularis]